mgnify:CR=1 FL=1
MYRLLVYMTLVPSFLLDLISAPIYKKAMGSCGKGVYLRPFSSDFKGVENFYIGDGALIPKGSTFYSTRAKLIIGKKVIFGPKPTIITGDHPITVLGKHIVDVKERWPENDGDVIIEDGVWCGAGVTILKGLTIGRGSVVAAGAVVTKSFPPYSIIGGVPAKLIKMRFTPDQIKIHEHLLNNN